MQPISSYPIVLLQSCLLLNWSSISQKLLCKQNPNTDKNTEIREGNYNLLNWEQLFTKLEAVMNIKSFSLLIKRNPSSQLNYLDGKTWKNV